MLADFCLRLALGMSGCLLLLSPAATARPAPGQKHLAQHSFFRTQFLVVLGLSCLALCFSWPAPWLLAVLLGASMLFACLGSVTWSLERSPGAVTLLVLTIGALFGGMFLREEAAVREGGTLTTALAGALLSSALLGAAISAMLMGHSYLIAPGMSLTPLYRLLGALATALILRMLADGAALAVWLSSNSLMNLQGDALLWLPVRWGVGLVGPLVLCCMAWQTARIRSTQSATGILYVVVIMCFLGELIGLLLRDTGLVV
jgi:hypothetical protein